MESTMLGIKYVLFLSIEIFVLATLATAFVLGVFAIVKEKLLASHGAEEARGDVPQVAHAHRS